MLCDFDDGPAGQFLGGGGVFTGVHCWFDAGVGFDRNPRATTEVSIDSTSYTITVSDVGELQIIDSAGIEHPFYFEMWFSAA